MNRRTFKFKTGKPVKAEGYVAFMPTIQAERDNAERYAAYARQVEQHQNAGISVLEALMGLTQQAGG